MGWDGILRAPAVLINIIFIIQKSKLKRKFIDENIFVMGVDWISTFISMYLYLEQKRSSTGHHGGARHKHLADHRPKDLDQGTVYSGGIYPVAKGKSC